MSIYNNTKIFDDYFGNSCSSQELPKKQETTQNYRYKTFEEFIAHGCDLLETKIINNKGAGCLYNEQIDSDNRDNPIKHKRMLKKTKNNVVIDKQEVVLKKTKTLTTNDISLEEISEQIKELIEENNKLKKRIYHLENSRDYKIFNNIKDLKNKK